ncbi:site-specific integrase [Ruegeria sp. HKCCD6428]|uniref:tyrosine-type recombinase/integrase n=1 Tax=Ruegeria sp. HKCCD6428 TaxID=2683002 RepID=UPI001490C139|nr:site-specific integrase [Ruegeria sp. HKCCD6428]NOC83340.1 tyrosine-type recombinase/integrase [Ruegeria sp. HKCCD6428]
MATINKRPSGKWQATVRRAGRSASKTFTKRADAVKWARDTETNAERSDVFGQRKLVGADAVPELALADALHQLADEQAGERWRLHALARTRMAKLRIDVLTVDDIVQWRDLRMRDARPSTVVRELSLIQTAIDRQLGDRANTSMNPVRHVKRPRVDDRRERRLTDHEWQQLLDAAGKCLNPLMRPLLVLARETAMRRGELLSMEWCNVDLDTCTVLLPKTKNGHARLVPLSPRAVSVLSQLPRDDGRVLPITTNAVRLAWQRLRARAGVDDIRLHDLRAQAATDKLLDGWSVAEVQVLTGHRDAGVLLERYARLRATDVVAKMRTMHDAE